ncbi:Acetyltransferase (GNAT) domain-containing protein [Flavobacterium sp. CF108]|jgi:N-acetylglutamate synthase-like GNAT family acetyltransferase|uniref:GNAT family N-acetyltransferase n=1 Tax=unclassified Flavobacterium TaxID=196869 RepID=UPI0008C23188|nr:MULTISPECIES: GNAT family N-acetyltransferase [unclassified Flavobacterium]SEN89124.1 Acetyltransferase (GNAT) domain-containing protein [Flavobacterium sp. fv08]SHH24038.1 Acetyltransferase (GNAT) domain-containing protein [Flavobacterium sp. CF108]
MEIKAIQASQTWQIRHEVMWPDQPFEFVQLEEDNSGFHFGVSEGDKLVSIVSCFIEGKEMQFRKLATLTVYQGKGIASHLLEYILQFAKEKHLEKVWCNARTNKKSFYEKFGMKDTFKTFTKAGQEFTIMEIIFLK